ncbi:MAG: YegP family protein [Pseudomonadota bacterium]|nr:YegP family protein [Pseudomonadota bacterium]
MATGIFELKAAANDKFHFTLKASNGQVIASSQMYKTKKGALNGIESIRSHAADATLKDTTEE